MADRKQPSDYFIFERPAVGSHSHTHTVVYVGGAHIEVEPLIERLRDHHLRHVPPERVVLIGPESRAAQLTELAGDSKLTDTLPSITRYLDTPAIETWTFDASGTLVSAEGTVDDEER